MSKKPSKTVDPMLPIGRAIINRQTGQPVGPIAPIYKEDWPFQDIACSETLWRYLDLFKFKDLLETSTLYFARPDTFTDSFEGRFSEGNHSKASKSDEIFSRLYKVNHNEKGSADYHEIHRKVVFISCWHRDTKESLEMWQAYTQSSDSVVITTSRKALRQFLPKGIMQSAVRYSPLDAPRTEFTHNSLFFYKPLRYSFEREFRLLRTPQPDEIFHFEDPKDKFRRVPIPTRKIVHRVITHPCADSRTKSKVDDFMRAFLPGIRRSDSALPT
jgi:hypothetical protein